MKFNDVSFIGGFGLLVIAFVVDILFENGFYLKW